MATLGEYMQWLREQGGQAKSEIGADPLVGMVPLTKLTSPSGLTVFHYGTHRSEELSPLLIESFDRRLHMLSPFRSSPRA